MKRSPYLVIIIFFLLLSCELFTPNATYSSLITLFVFSEDSSSDNLVVSYPVNRLEFNNREVGYSISAKINTGVVIAVDFDTNTNPAKGWNPEDDFWIKIAFSPGEKIYGFIVPGAFHVDSAELNRISDKLILTKEGITDEEKEIFINYIKDQIELGSNWAATNQTLSDTELIVGDY